MYLVLRSFLGSPNGAIAYCLISDNPGNPQHDANHSE